MGKDKDKDRYLARIGRIGAGEDDLAITDGEGVIRLGLGVNPNSGFIILMSRGIGMVSVFLNKGGHMVLVGILLTLERNTLDWRRMGWLRWWGSMEIRFTTSAVVRAVRHVWWWRRCVIEGRWWCIERGRWVLFFFFVPPLVVLGAVVGVSVRVIHCYRRLEVGD